MLSANRRLETRDKSILARQVDTVQSARRLQHLRSMSALTDEKGGLAASD